MTQMNASGEEVRRQLANLVELLIARRRAEAERLLDNLCANHIGHGLDFPGHFRSVEEVSRLRLVSCSDPSAALELLETVSNLWQQSRSSHYCEFVNRRLLPRLKKSRRRIKNRAAVAKAKPKNKLVR